MKSPLVRRAFALCFRFSAALAVVTAAYGQATIVSAGQDWPTFLGPNRNSTSLETGIPRQWPATGLEVVWHVPTGTGYGTCVVADERCFFFDRVDDEARLRCLDANNGKLLWQYRYRSTYKDMYGFDNGPRSSPTVDGDYVYVHGAEGQLHCVRVEDGARVWMQDTSAEFGVLQNFFGVGSSPLVYGKLLIVCVGGSPPDNQSIAPGQLDQARADGTALVAFDKRTGDVIYKTGDDLASYASPILMSANGRELVVALMRDNLLGIVADTGQPLFSFPWRARKLESVNAATPIVYNNQIFITESYELGCCLLEIDEQDQPQIVWRDKPRSRERIMASHWVTPVREGEYLYGVSGESSGTAELRCIEWATGTIRWRQPGLTRASLLLVDEHIICASEDGTLRLIKATPESYQELASCRLVAPASQDGVAAGEALLKKPVWSAPVLAHGLLYLRGEGRLVCARLMRE